ncbi:kinase [Pseudoluteimonas lycopersici]|uniref:Kinase n=1 Tax=Pseudoluteimonas lycopersici TaxID=1324796 RepID=A0A516V4Q0_9GAMM|nr:kinase [Lysobacter lycopersici]QDQ73530.1 kinase [Lysobacter lycopersici]
MASRTHSPSPAGYSEPFVAAVLDDALAHDLRVYAIAGLQGSGKSTLSAQVAALAATRGLRAVVLSIDDFYLGRRERLALGREVHPLLATRGAPGSHDVPLAIDTIDALREGRAAKLPRFDKIADRRLPPSKWPTARDTDLVLFEGWFQKVPAQTDAELVSPLNALERDEDADGTWRRWCNAVLGRNYPPLWERIDRMLFLEGPGFEIVPEWRWQQEVTLQKANPDRQAMTHAQVLRFVQFFERVSRQALRTLPAIADRHVRLDATRRPLDPLPLS